MIITIILILLMSGSIYIAYLFDYERLDNFIFSFLGIILAILMGIYLSIHILCWSTASYGYEVYIIERKSFIETLEKSRADYNPLERATVMLDISKWNQGLLKDKYKNKLFLLDDYIDDRIENIEIIE